MCVCVCVLTFTCSPLATVCFHAFIHGLMICVLSIPHVKQPDVRFVPRLSLVKCFSEAPCGLQCPKYTYILIDLTALKRYMLNKVRQMHAIKTVRLGRGNLNNTDTNTHTRTHSHTRVACMLSEYKSVHAFDFSCRLL